MNPLVVLTYFDCKIGPTIFNIFPQETLQEDDTITIKNLMDQMISEGFFTFSANTFYSMNYYFEINSEWARGRKEFLMVSVIFNQPTSKETEKTVFTICLEFIEWLKAKENLFTAFYKKHNIDPIYHNIIEENYNLIESWLKEFYEAVIEETEKNLEEYNINSLFEKKNILETLKFLSKKPIPIVDLKKWYLYLFPQDNFHRMITTLFKCHMIFIPKIGGRIKAPFNIHIKKEVKDITNLVSLKNKLIKKFIQNNITKTSKDLKASVEEFHKLLEHIFPEKQLA